MDGMYLNVCRYDYFTNRKKKMEPTKSREVGHNGKREGGYMKSQNKVRLIISGLLLLFIFVMNGCMEKRHPRDLPISAENIIEKLSEDLNLSQSQKDSLKIITDDLKTKREELIPKKEVRPGPMGIFDIVIYGEEKKSEINAMMEHFRNNVVAMDSLIIEKMVDIHNILTPEQRQLLQQKMEEFEEQRSKRRGKYSK